MSEKGLEGILKQKLMVLLLSHVPVEMFNLSVSPGCKYLFPLEQTGVKPVGVTPICSRASVCLLALGVFV